MEYPYIWVWAKYPKEGAVTEGCFQRQGKRKGQRCRVVARSVAMNNALIEFEDGYQVITSRNGLRKAKS